MSVRQIDWEVRPRSRRSADGGIQYPPSTREIVPLAGGLWVYTPAVPNQLITADFYNATQQNIINNFIPGKIDDYSTTLAEMGSETDPYPGGAPSLATTLAGELERIRFVIHRLQPSAVAWYAVASVAGGTPGQDQMVLKNNAAIVAYRPDGVTQQSLLKLGADGNVYIAQGLPSPAAVLIDDIVLYGGPGSYINMPRPGGLYFGSDLTALFSDAGKNLFLGAGAASISVQAPTTFSAATLTQGPATFNGTVQVNSPVGIGGTLTMGGDIVLQYPKAVYAINTVKAWARVVTVPLQYNHWGFASIVRVDTGTIRFTLPAYAGMIPIVFGQAEAVSDDHAGDFIVTKVEGPTSFSVAIRNQGGPTGAPTEGTFNIIVI